MTSPATRYCGKRALWAVLLCGIFGVHLAAAAPAENTGFAVVRAGTHLSDEVYHLDAQLRYKFHPVVLEALDSGVPITLEMQIQVVHPRSWMWNEVVYGLSQRYRIQYHALTRQYLVINLNNGVKSSYSSLGTALDAVGTVKNLPILDRRLLRVGEHYQARLRTLLVVGALPSPLRIWAYFSKDWHQESDWYTWSLQ